jgi:hypothetical protein
MMNATPQFEDGKRYARAVTASKRARWDIDEDVIRGRTFDSEQKFLPDGLSLVQKLDFLTDAERRFASRIQGRTYANLFGLVERFVTPKVLELGQRHAFGDQVALEALIRFSDEEIKHQELFRRINVLAGDVMPEGYRFVLDPNEVAMAVLGKSTWSVMALICLIELYTQTHYKESIEPDEQLSELFRDVFRFHWMEESQHAVLDELEWISEDRRLDDSQRQQGVTGLIELVAAVDGLLQMQAGADAVYFMQRAGRAFGASERAAVSATFLQAYRYQYIFSGVQKTKFAAVLREMIGDEEFGRVGAALATIS